MQNIRRHYLCDEKSQLINARNIIIPASYMIFRHVTVSLGHNTLYRRSPVLAARRSALEARLVTHSH